MPSITTHYIHSNEVFKILNKETQKDIIEYKDIYNLFAQSHDYFYYSFNKEVKHLGYQGHHYHTKDYLINIIKYIIDNNLQDYKPALCYLYGSITHYVLDSTCHPYIFYKTGYYRHTKETLKYKGLHTQIEKDIDKIYYEKYYKKKYNSFNISKIVIGKPNWDNTLGDLIDDVFLKTYKVKDVNKKLISSIKIAKLTSSIITKDITGIKYHTLKVVDLFTKNHLYSYSNHHKIKTDYLNLEHKGWCNPCYKEMKHTESFDDLFQEATKKAANIIETAHNVIINKQDFKEIDNLILELDYSSGLEPNKDKRLEFFEF